MALRHSISILSLVFTCVYAESVNADSSVFKYDEGYHRTAGAGIFKQENKGKAQVKVAQKRGRDKVIKHMTPTDDPQKWPLYSFLDTDGDRILTQDDFRARGAEVYPDLIYKSYADAISVRHRNIIVTKRNGENVLLDVYLPAKASKNPYPVMVNIHGGGWQTGSKELYRGNSSYVGMVKDALNRGIAYAAIKYRLVKMYRNTDKVHIRDCVTDCIDVMRFMKKHSADLGIDPHKVFVQGGSAGGHLALMVGLADYDAFPGDPSLARYTLKPAGCISWYGATDFSSEASWIAPPGVNLYGGCTSHYPNRVVKYPHMVENGRVYDDWNNSRLVTKDIKRKMAEVSPVLYLNSKSTAVLHYHGTKDNQIPVTQARHLKAMAAKKKAPDVTVKEIDGLGHSFHDGDLAKKILKESIDFIADRVGTNASPVGVITSSHAQGSSKTKIHFDGRGSRDDGSVARYSWDVNGDGKEDYKSSRITHTFKSGGSKSVVLTVTDNDGVSTSRTVDFVISDSKSR